MPAVNLARRDRNPATTFRRIRSTIEILGAQQPREVLDWIVKSIGVGSLAAHASWWDVQQIIDRARVALDIDGAGDDDATLRRAIDEIAATCNHHLNVN